MTTIPADVARSERDHLSHHEQMLDAQKLCVPCKLCGGLAVITDAGPGAGYYIQCSNSRHFRDDQGCMLDERRVGGWAYNVMDWWNLLHASTPLPAARPDREAAIFQAIHDACADEVSGRPDGDIIVKGCEAAGYVDPQSAADSFKACIMLAILSALETPGVPGALLRCLDSWIDVLEEREVAKKRRWLLADDKRGLIMTLKNARAALAPEPAEWASARPVDSLPDAPDTEGV